jgi:hypothetical protein
VSASAALIAKRLFPRKRVTVELGADVGEERPRARDDRVDGWQGFGRRATERAHLIRAEGIRGIKIAAASRFERRR